MSDLSDYYLNSRRTIVQLDLFEIAHPNFTQAYRVVRNASKGVTVDLSDAEEAVPFSYYPARVTQQGARDDLDHGIQIEFGDLGETIQPEIDAVALAGGFQTKPTLRYWTFRSDQLAAPIYGPISLEIPAFSFNDEGATFEARAPMLNSAKTGERLTLDRFPMQRGFI